MIAHVQVPANDEPVAKSNGVPALNQTDAKPASKLSELDIAELKIADKFAAQDRYIGQEGLPWTPWVGPIEIKIMRFENRTGTFVTLLANRTNEDAVLGKHRHRGPVTAVTTKGTWHYEEYDWRAGPGDYIVESPGTIHTLHIGAHSEILFTVTGSIEFYNDDDTLRQTMDIFSMAKLYFDHCEKQGIAVDDSLWF